MMRSQVCRALFAAVFAATMFGVLPLGLPGRVAFADTLLTTFGNGPFMQASAPDWLWDGPTSELTLLANNPANYWQQASFGSINITGAIGVSLQASFLQTYGFTSSNDSFKVRLTSGSSGIPKAEALFNFLDFQGAQSATVAKSFTHVDNNFDFTDVQEIYLIGNGNLQYGDAAAGIKLNSLTAVASVPEPAAGTLALAGLALCAGLSIWRRRKRD